MRLYGYVATNAVLFCYVTSTALYWPITVFQFTESDESVAL